MMTGHPVEPALPEVRERDLSPGVRMQIARAVTICRAHSGADVATCEQAVMQFVAYRKYAGDDDDVIELRLFRSSPNDWMMRLGGRRSETRRQGG